MHITVSGDYPEIGIQGLLYHKRQENNPITADEASAPPAESWWRLIGKHPVSA